MGSRSKIVGINREEAETTFEVDEKAIALGNQEDAAEALILGDEEAFAEADWDEEYLDPAPSRNWFTMIVFTILTLAFLGWTSFFVWTNLAVIRAIPANRDVVALIVEWAMPTILIGILWLLAMRNSRAEASRFADVGSKLRSESEALEARMRTVNEEISLAREFLSQNARDLESVGNRLSTLREITGGRGLVSEGDRGWQESWRYCWRFQTSQQPRRPAANSRQPPRSPTPRRRSS